MNRSIGIDIGGTKCALSVGECSADAVKILHREEFPTDSAHFVPPMSIPMDLFMPCPF